MTRGPFIRVLAVPIVLSLITPRVHAEGAVGVMGPPDPPSSRLSTSRQNAAATYRSSVVAGSLAQAETDYRAGRSAEALQGFLAALESVPDHLPALLRLGNLHHQAGREDAAEAAYRRAVQVDLARRPSSDPELPEAREAQGKAWLNLALLDIARASRAIDALDAMGLRSTRSARDATARQVGAQRHRAWRAAQSDFGVPVPAAPAPPLLPAAGISSGSPLDAGRPEGSEASLPYQPYTVDRWIALPRRTTARPASGRSAVVEPITETPRDPTPSVEILRAPSSGGR
jgi:hypothetical protein